MIIKTLKEEHYLELVNSGLHCPSYGNFKVGATYSIQDAKLKFPVIKARCSQNCPYTLVLEK